MRYKADITAGSLKVSESRVIADLLLEGIDFQRWNEAIQNRNILQARSPATAIRLGRLIRKRLELMKPELWRLVRDGSGSVAVHAALAAAIKHSQLLGDFLDIAVREQHRLFNKALSNKVWQDFINSCRGRDPDMPIWSDSTVDRLRSTVFQILAQAGYIENTRSKRLQTVHINSGVLRYLKNNNERYVLRCIQVGS